MMEGRTIDYRPDGGGLDYHNSPLMAEIPIDNYSHIHRSIEHLRSIGVPPPLDHHRHLAANITDLRRYEHPDEIPEIKPPLLRLSEFKSGLHDIRVNNDQENDVQRQMTPQDDGGKGYSAPSTPLSENGGHGVQEEKDAQIWDLKFEQDVASERDVDPSHDPTAAAPTAAPFGEHPYWPKVSPDSAAHMSDDGGYHQQRESDDHHEQQLQQQRALFSQHESQDDRIQPPVSSAANSAFTPINSMAPHLNGLSHHSALPTRPYLYDPLHFQQGKQQPNSFPNQLISLHQIRNYAHQPSALLPAEHILPHALSHKDKQ
ncbi:unnamed protein product [Chilo suppressalis]|uniref:Uncharacterized protein n=1 Tax=Chilo suppressalis TaxID=168631 RepID=A0ABN8BBH3_CHISP|nr:unnamed protein product [Chilo suppressalis]